MRDDCLTPTQMKTLRLTEVKSCALSHTTVRNRAAANEIPALILPHVGNKEKERAGSSEEEGTTRGYFENLAPGLESGLQIFSWPELRAARPPALPPGPLPLEWSILLSESALGDPGPQAMNVFKDLLLMALSNLRFPSPRTPRQPRVPADPRSLHSLGPIC